METFSALLALCVGNSPVSGEFPSQRPVTRSFDVFFDLCLNKRLSKQSWNWWFETPSRSLWRHCNAWSILSDCWWHGDVMGMNINNHDTDHVLPEYSGLRARNVYLCICGNITHWGRVTHICVGKLTIIGSDNGLSPGRRQAIIWTNAGILLIGPLGTNFSEILIEIDTFSFKKMHLKMSAKWRPFCLGLNVIIVFSKEFVILYVDTIDEIEWLCRMNSRLLVRCRVYTYLSYVVKRVWTDGYHNITPGAALLT